MQYKIYSITIKKLIVLATVSYAYNDTIAWSSSIKQWYNIINIMYIVIENKENTFKKYTVTTSNHLPRTRPNNSYVL